MPTIDLIDETYVVAAPADVAAAVHDTTRTRVWWPDLELTVFQDRDADGLRWTVTGGLVGTAEIWLQPFADGTLLHVFLRCDVTRRGSATEPVQVSPRRAVRVCRDRAWQIKQWSWSLKRELEGDRAAGEPRPGVPVEEVTVSPQAPVAATPEGAVDAPGQPR